MSIRCPICDRGNLHNVRVTDAIRYADDVLTVDDIEVARCDVCGEETVLPEQLKRNELRFVDAKRVHDRLLTSAEIIGWRKSLKVTQAQAAKILGGGQNALSKYERGEVVQSRAMDNLMRVSREFPEVRRFLFREAGIPLPETGWIEVAAIEASSDPPKEARTSVVLQGVTLQSSDEWSASSLSCRNG